MFWKRKFQAPPAPVNLRDAFINLRFLIKSQVVEYDEKYRLLLERMYLESVENKFEADTRLPNTPGTIPESDVQWYLYTFCLFMARAHGIPMPGNHEKKVMNITNLFHLPQHLPDRFLRAIGTDLQEERRLGRASLSILTT